MDAVDRATQMMVVPKNQLPPLALEFARKMCREVGMCGETYITAYAIYAQCVEGLPCDDALYAARDADVAWFAEQAARAVSSPVAVAANEPPMLWLITKADKRSVDLREKPAVITYGPERPHRIVVGDKARALVELGAECGTEHTQCYLYALSRVATACPSQVVITENPGDRT